MIVIRPITKKDLDTCVEFTFESSLGMRNLPRNRNKWMEKIQQSEESLAKQVNQPGDEEYFFVLEDLTTGRIEGTCGILATIDTRALVYRIENEKIKSHHPSIFKSMTILQPTLIKPAASEVCALYLQSTFRHSGVGRLLSLSRFLFMAAHPQRFREKIIAQLRGYIDQHQTSPFWEAIGHKFCNLSFVELMDQIYEDPALMKDIFPKYPIYIAMLPKEAQEVVGKIHENTKPALEMLSREGFAFNQEIDAIEGGPNVEAKTTNIRSIKDSSLIKIEISSEPVNGEEYILSNNLIQFRACNGKILFINSEKGLIHEEVAKALQVKSGEIIRYVSLRKI